MTTKRTFTVPSGAKVEIDDNNFITTEVTLDLSQIIDANNEGFLDMLSLLATDTEVLGDIDYNIERIDTWGGIVFNVTGDISLLLDMETARGEREEIHIDEVVKRITVCLAGMDDCGDIIHIANDVLEGKYTYSEDGNVTVEEEDSE